MRINNLIFKYDQHSLLPKYLQLADALRRWLGREKPQPGSHFPSDRQLANCCHTTPMTASKAVQELVRRKMVRRCIGAGSFVLDRQGSQTRKIGIFGNLPLTVGDEYMNAVVTEFESFWKEQGYECQFLLAEPKDYEMRIFEHELNGVMVITPEADFFPQMANLRACGIPLVSIGFMPSSRPDFAFGTNHIQCAKSAVEYLVRLGHRKIGVIGADACSEELRKLGYAKGMYALNLPVNPDWNIHTGKNRWEEGFIRMMHGDDVPTAAVVAHLRTAETVFSICHREGIRIPEQFSLIGFDHVSPVYTFVPKLTVLAQPIKDFTKAAALQLQQFIQGTAGTPGEGSQFVLEEGASCAPPPASLRSPTPCR